MTAAATGLTTVNFSLTNTIAPTVVSYSVLFGTQSYGYNTSTVKKIAINEGRTGIPELYPWGTQMKSS